MIHTLTERHHLSMVAPAAILRGIGRIDSNILSPSFFRFGGEFTEKFRPGCVMNALRKTMVMGHTIDVQIFNGYHTKPINDLAAFLMREIIPTELNPLMDTGYNLTVFPSLLRAFCQFRMLPLYSCELFFFLAEKAGIVNFIPIRQSSERLQPNINACLGRQFWQAFRFAFNRKGSVPFACAAFLNGERFDFPAYRTVQDNPDMPNTRGIEFALLVNLKTALWIGERVIAVTSTKTRKARCFSRFTPSEECLKSEINTHRYILKDLRVDCIERGTFLFQHRIGGLLSIARQAFACLLIRRLAHFKQVIIEPTTFRERFVQLGFLLLGWVYPIQKHFTHASIISLNKTIVKCFGLGSRVPHPSHLKRNAAFIPMLKR